MEAAVKLTPITSNNKGKQVNEFLRKKSKTNLCLGDVQSGAIIWGKRAIQKCKKRTLWWVRYHQLIAEMKGSAKADDNGNHKQP